MWRPLLFACVVWCGSVLPGSAQQRVTVLLSFNEAKIGPKVVCDGRFQATGGGRVTISPWCNDGKDAFDGAAYRVTTGHNAKTAQAAKLRRVYRTAFSRGMLLELDVHPDARLVATTKLGDFEVGLDELSPGKTVDVLDGKVRLVRVPNVSRLTENQGEEEYPSIAVGPDGQPAVAYVAWDGKQDRVMLRQGNQTRAVTPEPGRYLDPRCVFDGGGQLWIVWTASDGRRWDLWADAGGGPIKLTTGRRNDFWPRLARDGQGRLWLAWQTVDDTLHYEVMLARLTAQGLAPATNVSQHAADDWEPAVCTTSDGRIVVAWDTYRNGSFDVYLREFSASAEGQPKPLGPPRPVSAGPRREAHPTVAADARSRVWIAWDESVENWGKHPGKGATLHSDRSSHVACLENGQLKRPAVGLMQSLPEPLKRFIEYPQVAIDGQDRLWVLFRFENRVVPFYRAGGRPAQSYGMWHVLATQLDGRRWSRPVLLARSNGRQDIRVDVARSKAGHLLVVYGADGRTRRYPYVPVDYDVVSASLEGFGRKASPPALVQAKDLGRVGKVDPDPELRPLERNWEIGGKRYRLVLGDTHRHTDISRCMNGRDGSLQDAYRYALDCCGLDWLAISDHDQDILKHRNDHKKRPRQDYDWWRSQKYCDLYTIPGRFVALYGYEHGGSYKARGGHKNVILAERGHKVQEVDAPEQLFAALADSGALAIPHQLADGGSRTDWQQWNESFERVGEIFQARGSYEYEGCPRVASIYTAGHSMWDALAKGVRIGIIASSDHGQTHQARAGVFVEDLEQLPPDLSFPAGFTRGGILSGLRDRRAFGATTAVVLEVSVGDHPMGEEFTVRGPPRIAARVRATADLRQLEVIRDNRFVYSTRPSGETAAIAFTDLDLKPGQSCYYYVRAQIGENDYAWSSPVWVTRSE